MRPVARALLLASAMGSRAMAGEPAVAESPPPSPHPWFAQGWYGQNPSQGTWLSGVALERERIDVEVEVAHLHDPSPDPADMGFFQFFFAYRWELTRAPVRLRAEAVAGFWGGATGDVGFGAPELGGGLIAEWPLAPHLVAVGFARLTAPIPILESTLGLRLEVGRVGLAAGWRDLRFLPVFGIPGREASVPEAVLSFRF